MSTVRSGTDAVERPAEVALHQRWKFCDREYTVSGPPDERGEWLTDWGDGFPMRITPTCILCDTYLGTVEAKPAAWTAPVCSVDRCENARIKPTEFCAKHHPFMDRLTGVPQAFCSHGNLTCQACAWYGGWAVSELAEFHGPPIVDMIKAPPALPVPIRREVSCDGKHWVDYARLGNAETAADPFEAYAWRRTWERTMWGETRYTFDAYPQPKPDPGRAETSGDLAGIAAAALVTR